MLKERFTRVIALNHASIPHFLPRDHSCIYPVIVLQIDEKNETRLEEQFETRIIIKSTGIMALNDAPGIRSG